MIPTPDAGLDDDLVSQKTGDARLLLDILFDPVRMASVSELKHCGAAVPGQGPGPFMGTPRRGALMVTRSPSDPPHA